MVCSTSVFVSAEVYKSGTRELSGFIWFEGPATSVANACRKIFAMQARSLPRNSLDEVIRFCLSTYAMGVIHVSDYPLTAQFWISDQCNPAFCEFPAPVLLALHI